MIRFVLQTLGGKKVVCCMFRGPLKNNIQLSLEDVIFQILVWFCNLQMKMAVVLILKCAVTLHNHLYSVSL